MSEEAAKGMRALVPCPACQKEDSLFVEHREVNFMYGVGEDEAELSAEIPLYTCSSNDCGFEYMDDEGDMLEHEAVCKYLGILTPSEITKIRQEDLGLNSMGELADLTGLGPASIQRWESGSSTQSKSNDMKLRMVRILAQLVGDPVSAREVIRRIGSGEVSGVDLQKPKPRMEAKPVHEAFGAIANQVKKGERVFDAVLEAGKNFDPGAGWWPTAEQVV